MVLVAKHVFVSVPSCLFSMKLFLIYIFYEHVFFYGFKGLRGPPWVPRGPGGHGDHQNVLLLVEVIPRRIRRA